MPNYHRAVETGGTFFFTVVTHNRQPILNSTDTLAILRRAIETTRADRPFEIEAMVVLPDHLHAIWTLPMSDADYSTRWRLIKGRFSHAFLKRQGEEAGQCPALPMRVSRVVSEPFGGFGSISFGMRMI